MYALLTIPFLVLTSIVTVATAHRPGFAARMRASAWTALVLILSLIHISEPTRPY